MFRTPLNTIITPTIPKTKRYAGLSFFDSIRSLLTAVLNYNNWAFQEPHLAILYCAVTRTRLLITISPWHARANYSPYMEARWRTACSRRSDAAVLSMIQEVPQALPRFFGKKKHAALKDDEKKAMDAFFLELMAALGRVWRWNGEDRRQFGRDLDLYSEFAARPAKLANARKRGKVREEDPPFVGRVALLLDPSMLDQARRAARKFHVEVRRLAQKLLRQ